MGEKECGVMGSELDDFNVDMVNHPPHYSRGPFIQLGDNPATTGRDTMAWVRSTVGLGRRIGIVVECIEVIRHIPDFRLATAMKYIWRVAFGGKENDRQDIEKAIWYLNDWLENRIVL
jgi:hypothetical protein